MHAVPRTEVSRIPHQAYGCGRHPVSASEYAKISAIQAEMEANRAFDAVRNVVRRDDKGQKIGLSGSWLECMDLVWEEYLRRQKATLGAPLDF